MHYLYNGTRDAGRLLSIVLLLTGSVTTLAGSVQDKVERHRVYQNDRQFCLSGQSNQSRETCLREAGAVMQQNVAAQDQPSAEQMAANAVRRCDAFAGDEHQSCLARMQGRGKESGSVEGGGILRELTEPAQ
jgi:hypothetical protein